MKSIRNNLNNIIQKMLYPTYNEHWLFQLRFGWRQQVTIKTLETRVKFSAKSAASKRFFFPRATRGNLYEAPIVAELEKRCQPDTCFLDVGANLGFYSILAAQIAFKGTIHAFEIDPELVTEILRNRVLNGFDNLIVVSGAVWDTDGELFTFGMDQAGDKTTNVVQQTNAKAPVVATSLTLDSYCEHYQLRPNIVKIDVEGAEYHVLQGMKNILAGVDSLFLEIHPQLLQRFGNSVGDIQRFLDPYGFNVTRMDGYRRLNSKLKYTPLKEFSTLEKNVMLLCER